MKRARTGTLILAIGMLVAIVFAVRARHDTAAVVAPAVDTSSDEQWRHVPPMGDAMSVRPPVPAIDTAMPVMRLDTARRAHLSTARPDPRR